MLVVLQVVPLACNVLTLGQAWVGMGVRRPLKLREGRRHVARPVAASAPAAQPGVAKGRGCRWLRGRGNHLAPRREKPPPASHPVTGPPSALTPAWGPGAEAFPSGPFPPAGRGGPALPPQLAGRPGAGREGRGRGRGGACSPAVSIIQ